MINARQRWLRIDMRACVRASNAHHTFNVPCEYGDTSSLKQEKKLHDHGA
jgi:hypothetical protein